MGGYSTTGVYLSSSWFSSLPRSLPNSLPLSPSIWMCAQDCLPPGRGPRGVVGGSSSYSSCTAAMMTY